MRRFPVPYVRYLASPRWYARRDLYFTRHKKLCRACGARSWGKGRAPIHLHHLTYERLGNELDRDLMPLCKRCHGLVHRYHRAHSTQYTLRQATYLTVRRIKAGRSR